MSPEREREILRAALHALVEHGFDRLSMDHVAAAARASKATLYRHWPGKEELVADALRSLAEDLPPIDVPDTGSLRGDLHALVAQGPQNGPQAELLSAVIHACRHHPELRRRVREDVMRGPVELVAALVRRAVERGEVDAGNPAARFVLVTLVGPKLLRELVDDETDEQQYLTDYVDAVVLPALGVRPHG